MSNLEALMEMGFSKEKAERALQETGNIGILEAAEWLLSHEEEETKVEANTTATQCRGQSVKVVESAENSTAKGMVSKLPGSNEVKLAEDDINFETVARKCDECGETFRNAAAVSVHAIMSGHSTFTQCSESLEPLTKEEQQKQLEDLEKMMKQLEAERNTTTTCQKDVQKPHSNSLKRKQTDVISLFSTGNNSSPKEPHLDDEVAKRLSELKAKKMAEKALRQSILQDIARDREERRSKYGRMSQTSVTNETIYEQQLQKQTKKEFDTCRLQIRLTDGRTLTGTFDSKEELAAVRLYIDMNRTDGNEPFTLMTNFPKRIFTNEDMNRTLGHLGLPPSAVIIVSKNRQCNNVGYNLQNSCLGTNEEN